MTRNMTRIFTSRLVMRFKGKQDTGVEPVFKMA